MDNEKKKTAIVAGLVVAMAGVGAFQFVGGSSKPAAKSTTQAAKEPTTGTTTQATELDSGETVADNTSEYLGFTPKNPFAPSALAVDALVAPTTTPTPPPTQNNSKSSSGKSPRYTAGQFPGTLDPLSVGGPGGVAVSTAAPIRPPSEFAYRLSGVLDGPNPVAVFVSDSGDQKMVPLNGSVGKNSVVTSISGGKVTVNHNGKKVTLSVGGK